MITTGSKIKLVKPMGAFENVGEVCEVVKVTEDGVISFKFGNYHLGCMSYNEFEKYFELYVEPVKVKREWTNWKETYVQFHSLDDSISLISAYYRHNGKKIQVKCNMCKAESSCHLNDEFNLDKGLNLAIKRLVVKYLTNEVDIMASDM